MLKRFELNNYKNFKQKICIDFADIAGYQFSKDCITDDLISKMMIYGRNATGKTNLGRAIMDISSVLFHRIGFREDDSFVNADVLGDVAEFSYTFQFDGIELIYSYSRFSESQMSTEQLIVDGTLIFYCDFASKKIQDSNLQYIDAETINVQRYIKTLDIEETEDEVSESKLPFLRWLIGNAALEKDSILIKLADYIKGMVMITTGNSLLYRPVRLNSGFHEFLDREDNLRNMEDFLNAMGIDCRLALKKLPDGQRELYFAHDRLVPFYRNASSGTLALVDLYRRIVVSVREASLVYLDEFDAFYHYEMAENVVYYLKKAYPKCQIIMTSHNTNLMTNRLMRPDCLFILSGGGTLTALYKATSRELREGHNLEKMYISGEFEKYE